MCRDAPAAARLAERFGTSRAAAMEGGKDFPDLDTSLAGAFGQVAKRLDKAGAARLAERVARRLATTLRTRRTSSHLPTLAAGFQEVTALMEAPEGFCRESGPRAYEPMAAQLAESLVPRPHPATAD